MKKSNLLMGIGFIAAGVIFLLAAIGTESKLGGLLYGLAGACMAPGLGMVCQWIYWSLPQNQHRYQAKMKQAHIEQHDELHEKLRDRSGRYAYIFGLMITAVSIVVFSVLGVFDIITGSRLIVLYLGGYLALQIAAGILFLNHLMKQY